MRKEMRQRTPTHRFKLRFPSLEESPALIAALFIFLIEMISIKMEMNCSRLVIKRKTTSTICQYPFTQMSDLDICRAHTRTTSVTIITTTPYLYSLEYIRDLAASSSFKVVCKSSCRGDAAP